MRRSIVLAVSVSIVLAGCSASAPSADEPIPAGSVSPGATGGARGAKINQPPPGVEPSVPAEGESTSARTDVVARATEPSSGITEPQLLLIRNGDAGEAAAKASPAAGAAEAIRSWDRYAERALIVVYGGSQPDAGYGLAVDDVSITRGGLDLAVFGALEPGNGPAAQVISIPWAVLSVDAGAVALARKCFLTLAGQETRQTRC